MLFCDLLWPVLVIFSSFHLCIIKTTQIGYKMIGLTIRNNVILFGVHSLICSKVITILPVTLVLPTHIIEFCLKQFLSGLMIL